MFFTESGPRTLWDSFQDMERMLDTVQRAFTAGGTVAGQPRLNAWTEDDKVLVAVELPGVDPAQVEVSVEGDTLTLRGRRPSENVAAADGRGYRVRERADLDFERSLQLPFRVDAERAEARYAKGVLGITLHRHADEAPRRIAINPA